MIAIYVIRLLLDVALTAITVYGYQFGADLLCTITGFSFFAIQLVGGSIFSAAIFWLSSKIKNSLFFYLKCCEIYCISNPESSGFLNALCSVTVNWAETFTVPVLNTAVRSIWSQIESLLNASVEHIPDVLLSMTNTPIVRTGKNLTKRVFDCADECVLEWCYAHDDTLLEECFTGIAIFVKHSPKLIIRIIPTIIIQWAIRVIAVVGLIYVYIKFSGVHLVTIVPMYILILCTDSILNDAILAPIFMHYVLRNYSRYLNENGPKLESIKSALTEVLDLSDLKSLIRRFGNGNEAGDIEQHTEDAEGIKQQGVDKSI